MADLGRLSDVSGVAVGHWTDRVAQTGCTVVLLPEGTVASGEVRGGAPASRDFALLEPGRTVDKIDAIVLTGGSAFGLAAAEGVMSWLEHKDRGWPTPAGRVPIVPALALFDLAVGDGSVRPGPAEGRLACEAAVGNENQTGPHDGQIGAGTGCTTDKWRGPDHVRPGGIVTASERLGAVVVSVLVAVNAWGSVGGDSSDAAELLATIAESGPLGNTTIGVVATNAALDKLGCHLLAQAAHDGLARAVFPAHGRADGDAFIAVSTNEVAAEPGEAAFSVDGLRMLTVAAVERAILSLNT